MREPFAGTLERTVRHEDTRLAAALAPEPATLIRSGALHLAHTGPPLPAGSPICVFDGFLDDHAELATQLDLPSTLTVRQLLAFGYRRFGPGLLPRLRGDFALLIWDSEQGQGLLARDQLGVRCVYLNDSAGTLRFATRIDALLALLPSRPAPDPFAVAHLLTLSGRPGPGTPYTGIRRLNPGSLLILDRHGTREQSYWAPRYVEPDQADRAHLVQATRKALRRAVSRRAGAGSRPAVLMSGGLDSASVAALAAAEAPGLLSAYAGVFPEHPAVDESELIDELRRTLELPGVDMQVAAGGLLASAIESADAWQMPLLGWGDFWTLPLLRIAASRGVDVILGGDGGDELFGARSFLLADALRSGHALRAVALAKELPGAGDHPPRRAVARVFSEFALAGAPSYRSHTALWRAHPTRGLPRWLLARTARNLIESDDPHAWKRLDGPRWWAHTAHGLTRGIEEAGIFEHHARRAALAGLEARHPLLDLDLLELVLAQDPAITLDRHRNRPLLRASMAGALPDTVRLRPGKAWFDTLILDCLGGEDAPAIRRLLTGQDTELRAYIDVEALTRDVLDRRGARDFKWMHQVWRLTSVECWLRLQRKGSPRTLDALPRHSVARLSAQAA